MSNVYEDADSVSEVTYTTAYGKFEVGSSHTKNTNIGVPLREEDKKMFKNTSFDTGSAISADLREAEESIQRKVAQQKVIRDKIAEVTALGKKLKKITDKISQRGISKLSTDELEFHKSHPVKDLNAKLASHRKEADDLRSAVTRMRDEASKIRKQMETTFKVTAEF